MITKFINDITITAAITLAICGISTAVYTANINKMHQAEIAAMHVNLAANGASNAVANVTIEQLQMDKDELKSLVKLTDAMLKSICKDNKSALSCISYSGAVGEVIQEQLAK